MKFSLYIFLLFFVSSVLSFISTSHPNLALNVCGGILTCLNGQWSCSGVSFNSCLIGDSPFTSSNSIGDSPPPLILSNFTFNIPLNSIVTGMQLDFGFIGSSSFEFSTNPALIQRLNNVFTGDVTYGNSSFLWGQTFLSVNLINDPTFKLNITIIADCNNFSACNFQILKPNITIYFQNSSSSTSLTLTSNSNSISSTSNSNSLTSTDSISTTSNSNNPISSSTGTPTTTNNNGIIIGVVVGFFFLFLIILVFILIFFFYRKKNKRKNSQNSIDLDTHKNSISNDITTTIEDQNLNENIVVVGSKNNSTTNLSDNNTNPYVNVKINSDTTNRNSATNLSDNNTNRYVNVKTNSDTTNSNNKSTTSLNINPDANVNPYVNVKINSDTTNRNSATNLSDNNTNPYVNVKINSDTTNSNNKSTTSLNINPYANLNPNSSTENSNNKEQKLLIEQYCSLPFFPKDQSKVVLTNIELVVLIGKGNFGEVWKGIWRENFEENSQENSHFVALKAVESKIEFDKEAFVLSKLFHPNIVKYLGTFKDQYSSFLVTEFISGGSLDKFILDNNQDLIAGDFIEIGRQTCAGMIYLSSQKIIHRDLALRNLLIQPILSNNNDNNQKSCFVIKIADFGLSRVLTSQVYQSTSGFIPLRWAAPEVLLKREYSIKSDIWSFGIVLWELFSIAQTPYPDFKNQVVLQKVVVEKYRLYKPTTGFCTEDFYQLVMRRCWEEDPNKRSSFEELFVQIEKEKEKVSASTNFQNIPKSDYVNFSNINFH